MNAPDRRPAHATRLSQEFLSGIARVARQRYKVPAVAIAVMNADSILHQVIQGTRVSGRTEPATLDDFFHIGSCTKSVLAVMAAKQIEQKRLTWQTRFFDVLPELKADADSAYQDITLEDLFLCEAGIKAYTNAAKDPFPEFGASIENQRLEFSKYLVAQPPASAKQGRKFRHLYSNASYTLAAAMLEKVSGQTYEALVKQTLIHDLGLGVHIGWPNRIGLGQPWGHLITRKGIETFAPEHEYRIPHLLTPAGDLSMTPKDYARYTQFHLQGLRGNSNYLSSESYRHIHFGHKGFALGVANGVLGGQRYSGFDGSAGTFFCRSIIAPDSDFAFTIMTNAGTGSGSMPAVEWLTLRIVKKRFNWWWKFWL